MTEVHVIEGPEAEALLDKWLNQVPGTRPSKETLKLLKRFHAAGPEPTPEEFPLTGRQVKKVMDDPGVPSTIKEGVTAAACMALSPWELGEAYEDANDPLFNGLMQVYIGGGEGVRCVCGASFDSAAGMHDHYVTCAQAQEEKSEMDKAIPSAPSNRQLIKMLEAWGATISKPKGNKVAVTFPDHKPEPDPIYVFAPHIHSKNTASILSDIYKTLGVSPAEFWSGPPASVDILKPTNKEEGPIRTRHKGYINKVLDLLVQSGVPMSLDRISDELGISQAQAGSATSRLAKQDAIERVKAGVYVAKQYAADFRIGVDVTSTPSAPPSSPQDAHAAPEPPITAPKPPEAAQGHVEAVSHAPITDDPEFGGTMDDIANDFLEMIFPRGFKVKHLPAIDRWRKATVELIREVIEDA